MKTIHMTAYQIQVSMEQDYEEAKQKKRLDGIYTAIYDASKSGNYYIYFKEPLKEWEEADLKRNGYDLNKYDSDSLEVSWWPKKGL